ncbi:hypothetical protein QLS71_000445 [Mariniflexile litorale]|uniref:Uncharacterized protein n=1 Tax=Mariniflexile litorale TaxID=3045158 RepID=A0AAU7EG45_9FLAO|nr:hypothetical protein [Mariniflexile sp. KMM 9835]MDQ8211988.1 hypothetical protein [Mariniflexile sp. KMM 9835]
MKAVITIIIITLFLGCKTMEETNKYTITKIEQGKDGQTLYLKDSKNNVYTTVISIPNGNFVKVEEGNKIKLEIIKMIETYPPILVSKSIEIIK